MNSLVLVLALVASVVAEPTWFRSSLFQRQEEAPYPPSGYRPAGEQFNLPNRQQTLPAVYGPPETTTTTEPTTTESSTEDDDDITTVEPLNNQSKKKDNLEEADEVEEVQGNDEQEKPQQQGVYYILLPTGQLQRVEYYTTSDSANMAFSAKLQYQNVEPIREPIYTYNPNSPILQLVL